MDVQTWQSCGITLGVSRNTVGPRRVWDFWQIEYLRSRFDDDDNDDDTVDPKTPGMNLYNPKLPSRNEWEDFEGHYRTGSYTDCRTVGTVDVVNSKPSSLDRHPMSSSTRLTSTTPTTITTGPTWRVDSMDDLCGLTGSVGTPSTKLKTFVAFTHTIEMEIFTPGDRLTVKILNLLVGPTQTLSIKNRTYLLIILTLIWVSFSYTLSKIHHSYSP